MQTPITFIKGDKIGSETDYRDSLPVNMFAVERPILGADGYMILDYGLTEISPVGDAISAGTSKGGVYNSAIDRSFRLIGDRLYILTWLDVNSVSVNDVGSLAGFSYRAPMPFSFENQAVLTASNYYLYNYNTQVLTSHSSDLNGGGAAIDMTWIDGYFVFTDGEFVYHTLATDETSIDPLGFSSAELSPDGVLAVSRSDDNLLIVWGRFTIEQFYNAANPEFAFTRASGRSVNVGLLGTNLKAKSSSGWYFIGSRENESIGVHVLLGSTVQKVSTREIDKILDDWVSIESSVQSSFLESRKGKGEEFIIIHLNGRSNGDGAGIIQRDTLLFNVSIAKKYGNQYAWSYSSSYSQTYNPAEDELDKIPYRRTWRARDGIYDPKTNKWTYGDKFDNRIGLLDEAVATHYDEPVEWILDTPFYALEGSSIDQIEIETIPGFTTTDDATVFLSLTYNGISHTSEFTQDYGQMFEYGKRFIIRRLGYVRDWVSVRLRGVSRSRMAFGKGKIEHD